MFRLIPSRLVKMVFKPAISCTRFNVFNASFTSGRKRSVINGEEKIKIPVVAETQKKPDKQTIAELLKDIDITSSELSTEEAAKLEQLDKILTESPELKNMSMEEIIGMLNITEDDKKQLSGQVQEIMKSGNIDMKDKQIAKDYPAVDPAMNDMMQSIEAEFMKDPSLREEFNTWMKDVQSHMGENLEKMDSMSEEEVNKISLPPPRLRSVMDRIIPDTDKFNNLKLDEGMKMEMSVGDTDEDGEPLEVEEIKMR